MKKSFIILSCLLIVAGSINAARIHRTKIYTEEELRTIAFPVGGLASGNITIGGRGEIREMEIFNFPSKGIAPNLTFFSIWVKPEGKNPTAKILERKLFPPYVAWNGIPRTQLPGISRFDEVFFRGEYPFAWIEFKDKHIPLKIILETYNPFIPLDPERSGIPGAVFNWKLSNENNFKIKASLCFSMQNPIQSKNENGKKTYGKDLNQYI
jgi:non-lysosomal glucosylceramidase